jgi:hypothetical protein
MSTIEDYEEVDFSEDCNPTSVNAGRVKSKIKVITNKSRIPVLDSTCIDSNTYDYEKLMSLISPKRLKHSVDIDTKRFNALATPKRKETDLPDRLLYYQQLSDNRTRFKRIEQENKEMESCTFSPKINNSNPRRSFSKFLETQKDFQKIKRVKIDKKKAIISKEKEKNKELSPKIEISPGSQKIMTQKKGNKPVHERLYEDSKTYKKNNSIFNTEGLTPCFSPDYKSSNKYLIKEGLASDLFGPAPKSPTTCVSQKK